jgi:CheY-like chemotaxis protein
MQSRTLTIKETGNTRSEVTAMPSEPSLALGRRRVLVAEDDPSLRRLIVTVLQDAGYAVVEAQDGAQLLEEIEQLLAGPRTRSDSFLIVTDINMPGLTGLDVLAILRCASARTPVVLITAFGDAETHAEARELGAITVLDKPFDVDVLRDVVEQATRPCGD